MRSRSPRKKGFTLIEALVALAMLGLVIGLVADTASEYADIILLQREKEDSSQLMGGLERMARELEMAVQVDVPAGASASDELSFQLVDVDSPERAEVGDGVWTPWSAGDVVTVTYYLQEERLMRRTEKDGDLVETEVAPTVNGFSCVLEGDRAVRILASIREKRKVESFTVTAYRWVR